MAEADEKNGSGALPPLLRAFGAMLGLHVEYAQREAANDLGRVIAGLVLLLVALLFALVALFVAHAALVLYLAGAYPELGTLRALGVVAGADVALAFVLAFAARARLKRPILERTRSLVRRTVDSLTGT